RRERGVEATSQAPAVKDFGAVGGDLLEAARKLGLDDQRTERRRRTVTEKDRSAARVRKERRPILLGEMAVGAGGAKTVAGKGDRLGKQVAPGQPAVHSVHHTERGHGTRDRYRHWADAWDSAGVTPRRRGGRRGAGPVEHDGAAG